MLKMKRINCNRCSILMIIILIGVSKDAWSQSDADPIEYQKNSLGPVFYSLKPNININPGFSISYRIPGYISIPGELDFAYRMKNEDGIWFGFGFVYLIAGYQKKVIELPHGKLFANISLGLRLRYFLGRFGFSWFDQLEKSQSYEISIDAFFDHGINADMFMYDADYVQGISLTGNYYYELLNN